MNQENEKKKDSAPDPELAESMMEGALSGMIAGKSIPIPGVSELVGGLGFVGGALAGGHDYFGGPKADPNEVNERFFRELGTNFFFSPVSIPVKNIGWTMLDINRNKDELRRQFEATEAAWASVSPRFEEMGLGALCACVDAAIAAERKLTEFMIVGAEALNLFIESNDVLEELQEILTSRFGPVFSDFAQDQVLAHMPSKTGGLKGAAMDRYREQSTGQAEAMAKMVDASNRLADGIGNLLKAHHSFVIGFGATLGAFVLGAITFLISLATPGAAVAAKIIAYLIEAIGGMVSALITQYNTARDDVLNNIRKIREISIVSLRKWPEGAIGYTGS